MKKNKIKLLKEYALPIMIIFVVWSIGFVGIYFYSKSRTSGVLGEVTEAVFQKEQSCVLRRKIDGICLKAGEKDAGVFAVMIDNLREARPQSGLSQASLVYEAVAEGDITRFLAVFSLNDSIEKIGPVRSARPYYIDFAREFKCPYLHVGGSPDALDYLSSAYKFDLNEMSRGQYFWRDKNRYAPHNVYSSTEEVKKAIEKYKWEVNDEFDAFVFKEDEKEELRGQVKKINVYFSLADFVVNWEYDEKNNVYERSVSGQNQKDANDGESIKAKNLVVIPARYVVLDNYGRQELVDFNAGTGVAYVFQDGKVIEGTWKKENKNTRRKFFDQSGKEINFNVGQTWIEILPKENKLIY